MSDPAGFFPAALSEVPPPPASRFANWSSLRSSCTISLGFVTSVNVLLPTTMSCTCDCHQYIIVLAKSSSAYVFLDSRQLDNPFVDGALRDEPVNRDLAGLAETMSTIHGLRVVGRVPVMVVEDDGVGRRQVDTQPTRTSAQDEDEDVRPSSCVNIVSTLTTRTMLTSSATP